MYALFAYGTLTIAEIMKMIAGRSFSSKHAVLHGFVRSRIKGATYPGIMAWDDSHVKGKLYFNIDDDALEKLDAFEDQMFERILVHAVTDDGMVYEAFTFKVKDAAIDVLTDQDWDREEFKRKHMSMFLKD